MPTPMTKDNTMPRLSELAERVVDSIIGATIDALDDMNGGQGRYQEDAAQSRATAIEIVTAALRARSTGGDGDE